MQGKKDKLYVQLRLPSVYCQYVSAQLRGTQCYCLLTGKFQMQVLPQCGHAVHEDAPEKVRPVYVNVLCAVCCLMTI